MEDYHKHLENCYFYLIAQRQDLKPDSLKDTLALAKSLAIEYTQECKDSRDIYQYLDEKFKK